MQRCQKKLAQPGVQRCQDKLAVGFVSSTSASSIIHQPKNKKQNRVLEEFVLDLGSSFQSQRHTKIGGFGDERIFVFDDSDGLPRRCAMQCACRMVGLCTQSFIALIQPQHFCMVLPHSYHAGCFPSQPKTSEK
jgi:hypothetical protein